MPYGVTQSQATRYHVEIWHVRRMRLPQPQDDQQACCESGSGADAHKPLDMLRNEPDHNRTDGTDGTEADQHRTDAVNAARARHVRLEDKGRT